MLSSRYGNGKRAGYLEKSPIGEITSESQTNWDANTLHHLTETIEGRRVIIFHCLKNFDLIILSL